MTNPVTAFPGALVRAHIDVDALVHNCAQLCSHLGHVALLPVLKADAYGHGIHLVLPALLEAGIRTFGVATVAEAIQLHEIARSHGVKKDSLRVLCWLYGPDTDLGPAANLGIEFGLAAPWAVPKLTELAQSLAAPIKVHLKVDTGLGRNGATCEQFAEICQLLADTTGISVVGIMTHLANADNPADPANAAQLAQFEQAVVRIRSFLHAHPHLGAETELAVHAANSPASLSMCPLPGNMARVGVAVYGISPFAHISAAELNLRPVMSLVSQVVTVKNVQAGQGASYGLRYRAPQDTRFALVAGGYADGIPRQASGHAQVSIGGQLFPVVGTIAMDQMVVDIGPDSAGSTAPAGRQISAGDEVIIFGPGGPSVEDWAQWAHTINYDIVTRLGARVPRVPVSHGVVKHR